MTQIDSRFLSVHPETELWWSRRAKCESCRNIIRVPPPRGQGGAGPGGLRCSASQDKHTTWRYKIDGLYCIDARGDSGPCGPGAALYQPA